MTSMPALYVHQLGALNADSSLLDGEGSFVAPVALIDACAGFDESVWIDEIPDTILAVRISGAPVSCCFGKHRGASMAGSGPTLQPRGTPNHFRAAGPIRFAQIFLPDRLLDRVAEGLRPGAAVSQNLRTDLAFVRDAELERLVDNYLRAVNFGSSALEVEAHAVLMVSLLLRNHHGFAHCQVPRGGLSPRQVKRACEAMEASLDGQISLTDLAALAGCSATHFSRAFKQSTGLPPFQWLLNRRIERAKALLCDARWPLAEVALAIGFGGQPQFTTAFKRVTGVTPGVWRKGRPT